MFVVWYTGKGYQTLLIVLCTLAVFGASLMLLPASFDGAWYWAVALFAAAAVNWIVGTRANHVRRSKIRSGRLRKRLFYRAHHRFMSVPMETFSVFIVALAGLTATGLLTN